MIIDIISESDRTSLDLSSSSSSLTKPPAYFVESPSCTISQDDSDKSVSSLTNVTISPNHTLLSESRLSSDSQTSRGSSSSSGFRFGRTKRRELFRAYWPERNVIKEDVVNEEDYNNYNNNGLSVLQCRLILLAMGILVVFSVFCSVLWRVSHPFSPHVSVKSLHVHNFYYGEGVDRTGVATKILRFNSSLKVTIESPAPYFGIHVTSSPFKLKYSDFILATGQLESYYQPKKSKHMVVVKLVGEEVPLYGAGPVIAASDKKGRVPVKLEFEIRSRGNLLGNLVKSKHLNQISCSFFISSSNTKLIQFKEKTCKLITN